MVLTSVSFQCIHCNFISLTAGKDNQR